MPQSADQEDDLEAHYEKDMAEGMNPGIAFAKLENDRKELVEKQKIEREAARDKIPRLQGGRGSAYNMSTGDLVANTPMSGKLRMLDAKSHRNPISVAPRLPCRR